jgi:lysophospholipase L1-like esterase
VLGNSVATIVEPPRLHRGEGPWADHLRDLLPGIEIRSAARWYGLITEALRYYEPYVRAYSPDVLVLQYGLNEAVPRAIPMALHRHMFTWAEPGRRGMRRYKRALQQRLWPALREYQRRVGLVLGLRTQRVSVNRFASELRYLVDLARKDTKCLVLILDVLPPGPSVERWIPGIGARVTRLNEMFRRVVSDVGDDAVRYVDTSAVIARLGADGMPDGLHLSDTGHRCLADLLATEIEEWMSRSRG